MNYIQNNRNDYNMPIVHPANCHFMTRNVLREWENEDRCVRGKKFDYLEQSLIRLDQQLTRLEIYMNYNQEVN